MHEPIFASIGRKTEDIDVRLSYKIIDLFSKGLYTSPNKAIEELVTNSFDAGANRVHVLLSPDIRSDAENSSIVVIDDGEGMGADEIKQHWIIGVSNKRDLAEPPRGRRQIGKFGIGKLATYVLANRFTHISKRDGRYFGASIDYGAIDRHSGPEVAPARPVKIALRELGPDEAEKAAGQWIRSGEFKKGGMPLFGRGSPESWTISIMSDLKPEAGQIRQGRLEWVLSTALPLRSDFGIWLAGKRLESSMLRKGRIRKWVIGRDVADLPRPAPKDAASRADHNASHEHRHGLDIPGAGRVTGYVEAYQEQLRGKSGVSGRSHGFFVYVRGRLINADDSHFGISAGNLKHGVFSRFRAVVHMDWLDGVLLSARETVADSPDLETARCLLHALFNHARVEIEKHDGDKEPAYELARRVSASRASLSRKPIASLARSVAEGGARARHFIVPIHDSADKREEFLSNLDRLVREPDKFVTGIAVGYDGLPSDPMARFDTESGVLKLNAHHPFVAAFYDEFTSKRHSQPLDMLAMGEVLLEAHLRYMGMDSAKLEGFLDERDQVLRSLADESGHQSPMSVANDLLDASDPDKMEECVCNAFASLGFAVTRIGRGGEPDGVATAILPAGDNKERQNYKVSLEAKSKRSGDGAVSAKAIGISTVVRLADKHGCDHIAVVGPRFQTSKGVGSAAAQEIAEAVGRSAGREKPRTITLINAEDLAKLVRLRPVKHLGLKKIRDLFENSTLPEESAAWVGKIERMEVERPEYRRIVEAIRDQAEKFPKETIKYSALRTGLIALKPPIKYETDDDLREVCKAMAQMSQTAIRAERDWVELDQSAENAISSIENALREYRDGGPARGKRAK